MLFLSQNKMHIKLIIAMNRIKFQEQRKKPLLLNATYVQYIQICSLRSHYSSFPFHSFVSSRYHCESIYYFDDSFPSPNDRGPSAQPTFWQTKHVFFINFSLHVSFFSLFYSSTTYTLSACVLFVTYLFFCILSTIQTIQFDFICSFILICLHCISINTLIC